MLKRTDDDDEDDKEEEEDPSDADKRDRYREIQIVMAVDFILRRHGSSRANIRPSLSNILSAALQQRTHLLTSMQYVKKPQIKDAT